MLKNNLGNKMVWFSLLLLVVVLLVGPYYFKRQSFHKPVICCGEVRVSEGNEKYKIRKEYDVNVYLSDKNRALIFIDGVFIGEDDIPRTIQRTFSFDSVWNENRLLVKNVALDKNPEDNAPDDAFSMIGENDILEFEMLTRDVYLISTAWSKLACNIR
ncbi:FidL [Symbiopectobacterium purcellii]|uniref:FidL n=1 Tax=Symbiopectobacterium purcellii TaxID=2871826 RepID=UPI0020766CB3|nr:FidL [Symbiopectobacterium purcellii]